MNCETSVGVSEREIEAVRSTDPITINEFRVSTTGDATNNFIELYNSGNTTVNLSDWSLTEHAATQPINSTITVPAGTSLAAGKTYLLGLSASGLAAPAKAGASTISLRSTTGLNVGDKVQIGTGPTAETRTITAITREQPAMSGIIRDTRKRVERGSQS